MTPAVVLSFSDLAHGVEKVSVPAIGENVPPGNLRVEVNGVAGEVGFGPAPVALFDDETVISGAMDSEIFLRTKLSAAPSECS